MLDSPDPIVILYKVVALEYHASLIYGGGQIFCYCMGFSPLRIVKNFDSYVFVAVIPLEKSWEIIMLTTRHSHTCCMIIQFCIVTYGSKFTYYLTGADPPVDLCHKKTGLENHFPFKFLHFSSIITLLVVNTTSKLKKLNVTAHLFI